MPQCLTYSSQPEVAKRFFASFYFKAIAPWNAKSSGEGRYLKSISWEELSIYLSANPLEVRKVLLNFKFWNNCFHINVLKYN